MKAKDKAEELIEKFGIEKALLCVDEIIKALKKDSDFTTTFLKAKDFWNEVKQEILNRQ